MKQYLHTGPAVAQSGGLLCKSDNSLFNLRAMIIILNINNKYIFSTFTKRCANNTFLYQQQGPNSKNIKIKIHQNEVVYDIPLTCIIYRLKFLC